MSKKCIFLQKAPGVNGLKNQYMYKLLCFLHINKDPVLALYSMNTEKQYKPCYHVNQNNKRHMKKHNGQYCVFNTITGTSICKILLCAKPCSVFVSKYGKQIVSTQTCQYHFSLQFLLLMQLNILPNNVQKMPSIYCLSVLIAKG